MNYFLTKIKYEKLAENGTNKKVTEQIVLEALSFTEAEAKTIKYAKENITGEFEVTYINPMNISEIIDSVDGSDDRWYKAKVLFISLDEEKGTEKKTPAYMLVEASDTDKAMANLKKGMEGTMADYEVASLSDTKIMEVI